ncbi:MAG: YlxR family protein [Butyribacter sp.]|nr:YlxR family protein [bacterium]MDY3853451.1 YlxR family protein [Butyribacter sp.]
MSGKKTVHMKKTPMRQCTGCGERKEKKDLIRIIRTPEGEITVDFSGKKNGRGAYICNSTECLKQAQKKKSLERSLKTDIPENVYQELEKEMSEHENG